MATPNSHGVVEILNDTREIDSVVFFDDSAIKVGNNNVEKIVAYGEPAQYCNVPFLAVYKDGQVWMRIPAGQVTILYSINQEVPL